MVIYKEFAPSDVLSEFIKCFWVLEREYNAAQPVENVLPDSYIEFILNFGAPYYLEKPGDLPSAFMVGLLKEPLPLFANGTVKLVNVRFYPWGLLSFFKTKVQQNINTSFSFDLPEKSKKAIANHLTNQEHEAVARELEKVFLEKYVQLNFDKNTVNAAAQILYKESGEYSIEELARMCYTTQRTLQRNFSDQLGMTPKGYASNVRFDKAKKTLTHDPDADLATLAQESGYYDQAHFIKDFKSFCGQTPAEFAAHIREMRAIFTDSKNVVFLQE